MSSNLAKETSCLRPEMQRSSWSDARSTVLEKAQEGIQAYSIGMRQRGAEYSVYFLYIYYKTILLEFDRAVLSIFLQ